MLGPVLEIQSALRDIRLQCNNPSARRRIVTYILFINLAYISLSLSLSSRFMLRRGVRKYEMAIANTFLTQIEAKPQLNDLHTNTDSNPKLTKSGQEQHSPTAHSSTPQAAAERPRERQTKPHCAPTIRIRYDIYGTLSVVIIIMIMIAFRVPACLWPDTRSTLNDRRGCPECGDILSPSLNNNDTHSFT